VFTDLGLYLVGSLIIWVRLRASSLDCRTAGVISISQFRSPYSTNSEEMARTSGLAEYAKAVNRTNLGKRLLMLTCMKPKLLRLQKSTNDSAWGIGMELGATGPGLTSTSQEEQQRRSRIRTGRLVRR
jgi:hypothetical protein